MPTLPGVKYRLNLIVRALTKRHTELAFYPKSGTGLFEFLSPLLTNLPTVPASLAKAPLPDEPNAAVIESSEPEVSRTLYVLARLLRAKQIAEVGVFRGATSRHLSSALADNGGGELNLVDQSREALDYAAGVIGRPIGVVVRCHQGNSTAPEVLAKVPSDLDLVFLDADHSELGVRRELEVWIPKIRSGGIIAIHDTIHYAGICKSVHRYSSTRPLLTIATGRSCGLSMIQV